MQFFISFVISILLHLAFVLVSASLDLVVPVAVVTTGLTSVTAPFELNLAVFEKESVEKKVIPEEQIVLKSELTEEYPTEIKDRRVESKVEMGAKLLEKADYKKNDPPVYPRHSRRRGEQGLVVLKALVSPEGLPLDVEVHKSSGYELLDLSALKAVRKWEFVPAKKDNDNIGLEVLVPVQFKLKS